MVEYISNGKVRTAAELAKEHREISISEFFEKNRHLLGFDSKIKALLIIIKEAVDNALDACEEAGILPDVHVKIEELEKEKYKVVVKDNGPGIVKKNVANVFGKLLFGSKFHRLRQSLTGDQMIMIQRDGKIERLPIGEFVDNLLSKGEGVKDVSHLNMLAPSFDHKTHKYAYRPISHVIRHERANEIIEIKTQSGRSIKVTGCHSLFGFGRDGKVREIEARKLKEGDYIIAPSKLPEPEIINKVNILEYFTPKEAERHWWYVYGIPREVIRDLKDRSEIIRRRTDPKHVRKYYRINGRHGSIEILDDKMRYYERDGFLPAHTVVRLGLVDQVRECVIRTYLHGKKVSVPVTWKITPELMRFLGLYVSEGHCDKRQIAFTFSEKETEFISEIQKTARKLGAGTTIEKRERKAMRVKVFGGILSELMEKWCSRGALNKKIPEFVFRVNRDLRQHFIDALYQGDGHRTGRGNELMYTTVSDGLANDLHYLWLMQGAVASRMCRISKEGFKKSGPSVCHGISVFGEDINSSHIFRKNPARPKIPDYRSIPVSCIKFSRPGKSKRIRPMLPEMFRVAGLGFKEATSTKYFDILSGINPGEIYSENDVLALPRGRVTKTHINWLSELGYLNRTSGGVVFTNKVTGLFDSIEKIKHLTDSDLCLLKIKEIKIHKKGCKYVYDISVPGCENFVGGLGGLSVHNSRGQQGLGISVCVLYSQLTTGEPIEVLTSTGDGKTHKYKLKLDVKKNQPVILSEEIKEDLEPWHGVQVTFICEGVYREHRQSVLEYLKETAISNPHAKIVFNAPTGKFEFQRGVEELPREPKEIKPHLHGVELGIFTRMLSATRANSISGFLTREFSRVGTGTAKEICEKAQMDPRTSPRRVTDENIRALIAAIKEVKLTRPPTDCLSPLGSKLVEEGLKKELSPEFVASVTRSPTVYRGWPFQVEAGVCYGGSIESPALMRFANRVPLLYQQGDCAITKAAQTIEWRRYGISGDKLPDGPVVLFVHIASVWVPFTSESKEAVASYPAILKEVKLALQEAARKVSIYLSGIRRAEYQAERIKTFERYAEETAKALEELTEKPASETAKKLKKIITKGEEGENGEENSQDSKGSGPKEKAD